MIEISAGTLTEILGYVGKNIVEATCELSRKDGLRICDIDATHSTALNVNFYPLNHSLPDDVNEKIVFTISISDVYKIVKKFAQDVMFDLKFEPEENVVSLTAVSQKKKKTCLKFKTLSKQIEPETQELIKKINQFDEDCVFFSNDDYKPLDFTIEREELENAIALATNYNNEFDLRLKSGQFLMYAEGVTGEIEYYFDTFEIVKNENSLKESNIFKGATKRFALGVPPVNKVEFKISEGFPASLIGKNEYVDGAVKYIATISPIVNASESDE